MTYESEIATALELIAEAGKEVIWRKKVPLVDPAKPWLPPSSVQDVDYQCTMVFLPFKGNDPKYKTEAWSALIGDTTTGITKALMGAVPFEPSITDVVVVGTKVYTVLPFDVLAPNVDEPILYTLILKA